MATMWIVVADAGRARIFHSVKHSRQIGEIQDMVNPSAREPSRELVTDADGRVFARGGKGQPSHAAEPRADPVEHETELFAKRVAEALEKGRTGGKYDEVCLIAAPRFLGLLRANLGKVTRRMVSLEIDKDLSQKTDKEILDYVRNR